MFGPESRQSQDQTVRLDRVFAVFDYLDQRIGLQNVLITLSADHGFMNVPEYGVTSRDRSSSQRQRTSPERCVDGDYTDEELRILKEKRPLPPDLAMKIFDGVLNFTRKFYEATPDKLELPPSDEVPYTFIFRFSLYGYLQALR